MLFFKVVAALSLAICATALPSNLQSIKTLPNDQDSIGIKMDMILDLLQRQQLKMAQLERLVDLAPKSPSTGKQSKQVFRTCEEIRSADPESETGPYWIDPDGTSPLIVHCDMSTGSTIISHDSEAAMEATRCPDPGCYQRLVAYNATMRQITALEELSRTCRQYIRFDCLSVPFEFNGVQQAWWTDRHGDRQFFWAGSNSTVHTCQCGIEGPCADDSLSCNCDSLAAVKLYDEGYITAKGLLPVTKLNFGRTIVSSSLAKHTLGKLECSGKAIFEEIPESCDDLWKIGHTLNGFYDVKGDGGIRSVYCDFNKLSGAKVMETPLGVVDVKSTPVYFYVQRNTSYSSVGTTIPFEIEVLNVGGGMDISSGVFTAPVSGIYYFSFHGHKTGTGEHYAVLLHNSNNVAMAYSNNNGAGIDGLSLSSTLALNSGDTVSLRLDKGTLVSNANRYINFNGMLLKEGISL